MLNIKLPETDVIGCRFPEITGRNGKVEVNERTHEYFYRLLPNMPKPKKGDFVVVSCQNGFQVCVVTTLDSLYDQSDMAYVVGTVDVEAYTKELERQEQKKRLYKDLMKKKKELEESLAWDIFAERSPEFKALLEAYNNL